MTREHFLSSVWKRYPVVPPGLKQVGRLRELLRQDNSVVMKLERNGVEISLEFPGLHLSDDSQISIESLFAILVPGDLLAVSGEGELHLLTPRLKPLPQRNFEPQVLELWQRYLFFVGEFFRGQGFLEISTPSLVACPGTEPSLSPFTTEFVRGSSRQKFYLPTSPELHLKKALAFGAEKIFEIRKCFRNEEVTEIHQPEFSMIEWYRAFENLECIRHDVENLVQYLVKNIPELRAPKGVEVFSVSKLFEMHYGVGLKPDTSMAELQALAQTANVDLRSATTIDDCFFLLFLEKIESSFSSEKITFVENYPPYQAALARVSKEGWGERFEMYWEGLEIANAFHELNDPEIQKKRFQEDLEKKRKMNKEVVDLDSEFMQCLEAGMPPASGIALGLERLFMALTGIKQLSSTRLFPMS